MLNNPELLGKAVIVGGSKDRGVVTTCSYEARKFGVRSAMPMKQAMQLCPHAILLKGTRGQYSKYSRWVTDIIAAKAPLFEKASIDEFYIDLTGMDKYFDVLEWTKNLRQQIIDETKLPISFGLSSNKMISKIATDEAKPNGFLFVQPGKEKEFLAPLPYSEKDLEQKIGKWGTELYKKAQGISTSVVNNYREAKSISCENTFSENITDENELIIELVKQVERVCYELREDNMLTGCVSVKIRYPDFETTNKQSTIDYTLSDDIIIKEATILFKKLWKKNLPVRLLGVRLSELTNQSFQGNLFDDVTEKSKLYKAVDDIKLKFGKTSLQKARTVKK
ncbi:unnamed protein product [Rotaria sp. Silwood1]|nr:unnamed protein product [Rotaria sp. Silwood1]